ncbi:MAG: MBL fold metallo-hydrolase [Firmicutes bacterium]|nr:MBL fold metallo-hydrolase [Bacillota bacterium]
MRVTVLGCWAPYPRPEGACSGYLVEDENVALYLEAGHGSFAKLCSRVDFRRLTAAVVSHFHADHWVDLLCLRHAVAGARRAGTLASPLTLIVPGVPEEFYRRLAGYADAFAARAVEDLPLAPRPNGPAVRVAELAHLRLEFLPVPHAVPAYAVAVVGRQRFVFSGDTAWCEELARLAADADLFLCEASGLAGDERVLGERHLTAGQAGELARRAGVGRLVLTHFWPEYNLEEIRREAEGSFGEPVILAREGLCLEV